MASFYPVGTALTVHDISLIDSYQSVYEEHRKASIPDLWNYIAGHMDEADWIILHAVRKSFENE